MTEVVAYKSNNLPAEIRDVFNAESLADDLSSGVSGGFAVVSIRGSKWRIVHQGEETPVLNADNEPAASLEVVIVKGSPAVSKIYYGAKYVEGDDSPPDCWSTNGIKPDASAESPQAKTCAGCEHSVWGSKITEAGKKSKACADARRIAVVPAGDISNTVYSGPMLLRVPAASLADLAKFGKGMSAKGHPYNAIVTRIGFDIDASYPKLTFKAVRPLNTEQLVAVAEHYKTDALNAMLSAEAPAAKKEEEKAPAPVPAAKPAAVDTEFELEAPDAEAQPTKKKTTKKKAARKVAAAPAPAQEPEPSPAVVVGGNPADDGSDSDLDDILDSLNALD